VIDIKRIRQDPEGFRVELLRRGDASLGAAVDRILELDLHRRQLLTEVERLKAERNSASQEVARRKKASESAEDLLATLKTASDRIKALDGNVRECQAELQSTLLTIPNPPLPDVPEGDESHNVVVRTSGEPPKFDFEPKPHWELAERLGIVDLPRGAGLAGTGFPLYVGLGAKLIRALANFMIDLHAEQHGYIEVSPPLLVNRDTLTGTGQLPKFEDDLYRMDGDDMFLIPTAEVPLTNLHRGEILDGDRLPFGYVAFTPCFRREAGAHGKDTRGLIRLHQFDKVELVRFCRPEDSPSQHTLLTGHAEEVLRRLEIPYRVVALATGDTGFSSASTLDLEVWASGVETWLEASSSSTFADFQSRRANIRYRPEPKGKPEFVHTLNASGVAFPRTIIALLENNQTAEGEVLLPESLVPYMGTDRLSPRA
jgi:seryl-tRNA synthetase